MLNSAILDVVIALIFVFLSVSLAAGAVVEAFASLIKLRSTTLKSGIMDLLNDQNFNDLAAELYAHALISPRAPGLSGVAVPAPTAEQNPQGGAAPVDGATVRETMTASPGAAADSAKARLTKNLTMNMPAYIEPKQFAMALTDVLALVPKDGAIPSVAQLQRVVNDRLPAGKHPQINQLLHGVILRTGGDLAAIRTELASWFDSAMDRVSGVYKRYTQVLTFIVAIAISIVLNADALHVARRVWAQPVLVAGLKGEASALEKQVANLALAQSLPIGWAEEGFGFVQDQSGKAVRLSGDVLVLTAAGWLITALTSLFGAPFWFDTLQRVTRLKGSGPSPDEKANQTSASA